MAQRWLVLLFCGIVAYLTLFYQLGNLAFVGADEPRYARVGEEMNLRGSYVTPTLNFRPWLEKPPLLFWAEAASFKVLGVHEWSARLPVALSALFTLLMAGFLSLELAGWRAAILTALVLSTSGLFFVFGRVASTDMPLVAMLTAAMVFGFLGTSRKAILWGGGAGCALALAVLAKGPIAIVLFGGVFLLYFLWVQGSSWTWKQSVAGVTLFLTLAVPWFWKVWLENGYDFVATFWLNHHLARFVTGIHHHSQPFWFYFPVLIFGFFPWVFFLGSPLVRSWRNGMHLTGAVSRGSLFLWLWAGFPLLFFTLSESKLAGYILPVLPPLAVVVGLEWDRYLEHDLTAYRVMRRQLVTLSVVGLLLTLGLVVGFHVVYDSSALGVSLAVPLLGALIWTWYEFAKRRSLSLFLALVAGMTLFAGLAFWRAAPVLDDYHSARDLCRVAGSSISSEEPLILYRYFHHTARYYTDYQTTRESLPELQSLREYLAAHPQVRYYLLTQEPGWSEVSTFLNSRLVRSQGNLYLVEITALSTGPETGHGP